jgi:hypothetical protein
MVDSQGQSLQRGTKTGCFGFERAWPVWIVGDDLHPALLGRIIRRVIRLPNVRLQLRRLMISRVPSPASQCWGASGSSASLPEHRNEGWRPADLDCSESFEAVAPIQRNVSWISGFQVCQ